MQIVRPRERDGKPEPGRPIRARVHRGQIELQEATELPDGTEVTVVIEPVPTVRKPKEPIVFAEYDLGTKVPLTRADIYEDAG